MWKIILSKSTHYALSFSVTAGIVLWFEVGLFVGCLAVAAALFMTYHAEKVLLCRWIPGCDVLKKIAPVLLLQLAMVGLIYFVFLSGYMSNPEELLAHEMAEVKSVIYSVIFSILLSALMYIGLNVYRWKTSPYTRLI